MILGLNHVAIFVRDVEISAKFYEEAIGLERIARPAFDFPGAWFQIGEHQQLHIIGERQDNVDIKSSKPRGNHFAIQIASFESYEKRLQARGIEYLPIKKRPDGAMQIFIKDPDGYFVELVQLTI